MRHPIGLPPLHVVVFRALGIAALVSIAFVALLLAAIVAGTTAGALAVLLAVVMTP